MKGDFEKLQRTKLSTLDSDEELLDEENFLPREATLTPFASDLADLDYEDEIKKYFGYNFFLSRDSLKIWENLPAPSNYVLGPGDELVVSLWGETQIRNSFTVSRDGKIYDDKVGLLNIAGKDLEAARKYLKTQFGRVYSTLNGSNPTAFIDVSLGELKSINVNFIGEIRYPGVHTIHPFSSVILGLIQVGGVDTTGSLRSIEIRRNNKVINKIDLYDFFLKGGISSTLQLRDQDVVYVPPRRSYVLIDSAVVRPAIYESNYGESIYDLINYAGGPSFDASNKIGIYRMKPIDQRDNGNIYEAIYVDYNSTKLISSGNNDKIFVNRLFSEVKEVEIIGQIKSPGKYLFSSGMTLNDLFDLSGGFKDSTFLKSVYLNKAEIIRKNPDGRYDQVIPLNLNKILNNNENKIFLQNLDKVVIHSNLNFYERENVLILGEVRVPGSYPLIKDDESLESLINRSGGFTTKSLDNGIAIFRDKKYFDVNISSTTNLMEDREGELDGEDEINDEKIRVAWQNTNISLMPGDSIIVKEKTSTIFISGEVYNSGVLEFRKSKSLRYYINAAGGLTEFANKKGIVVLYPNGVLVPKKWYSSPKIIDGSAIIVNRKPDEPPFDVTQFATNWTSIISSMITAIVLSQQL